MGRFGLRPGTLDIRLVQRMRGIFEFIILDIAWCDAQESSSWHAIELIDVGCIPRAGLESPIDVGEPIRIAVDETVNGQVGPLCKAVRKRLVARFGTPPVSTKMQLAFFQNWWLLRRWNIPPVSIASTNSASVRKPRCSTERRNAVCACAEIATVNFDLGSARRVRVNHNQLPGH